MRYDMMTAVYAIGAIAFVVLLVVLLIVHAVTPSEDEELAE